MKTVIMAGGMGTRIRPVQADVPKPMIRLAGVPVLEHQIACLRRQGFTDLIITVSHMREAIMDYFGDGSGISPATGVPFGVRICYYHEQTPLGNAGALFKLRRRLDAPFLLINGDVIFDVDFARFVDYHRSRGGLVTLFTHPSSHPYDSGLVIADENGAVTQWLSREDPRPRWYRNRVNAGLHVVDPRALDATGIDPAAVGESVNGRILKVDLDRQVLKPLCGSGTMFCYDSPEYVRDMGTPDRFDAVSDDLSAGRVAARNLSRRQRAVFLDRDGTINRHVGFLRSEEAFELLPGVAEAIRRINASGRLAIVVTNQPVISRGEATVAQLRTIHDKMETLLGEEGAWLDAIYYCPHHPDRGFPGEIPQLKRDCDCRKPKPGMLLRARDDFNIDLGNSWMIGDGKNDVEAGKAAGCRCALIGSQPCGQDLEASSLLDAVQRILAEDGHGES